MSSLPESLRRKDKIQDLLKTGLFGNIPGEILAEAHYGSRANEHMLQLKNTGVIVYISSWVQVHWRNTKGGSFWMNTERAFEELIPEDIRTQLLFHLDIL